MNALKVIPFLFKNRKYEIRAVCDGATVYVRAFRNGKPANGYSYRADLFTTLPELKRVFGLDGIQNMIESAKEDVTSERWEKLLAIAKKMKK